MTVATFDYAAWAARYPELAANVPEALAVSLFDEAGLYLDNTDCSPVQDPAKRLLLLGMIVAHLAQSHIPGTAMNAGLVGRVSSASQGSVSLSSEYGTQSASAAFWLQSQYGARYWQATAYLRRARYVAGPPTANDINRTGYGYGLVGYRQPGQW